MFPGFFLEFYNFPGFLRFWCERAVFFFFFSFAVVSVIFLMISARSSIIRPILIGELFFPDFLKFGSNWRYVSIYGGVLSLYVEIFSSNKNKYVKFHVFGKKNRKIWEIEKLREKNMEIMGEKLSDNKDPYMLVPGVFLRVYAGEHVKKRKRHHTLGRAK